MRTYTFEELSVSTLLNIVLNKGKRMILVK